MENIKERIEDLVYGEITDGKERVQILSLIEKDPVLKEYYEQIMNAKESIGSSYNSVSDTLLERNREDLFNTIFENKKSVEKVDFKDFFKLGRPLLKYAAVILLTFYATMYHFGRNITSDDPVTIQSGMDRSNFRTVSTEQPSFTENFEESQYIVDNLKIDEEGENLTIDFDVSTNKTIKGKKNDPNIINALKYLIAHESNPGVKLRTLKAMDMDGEDKYTDALVSTI